MMHSMQKPTESTAVARVCKVYRLEETRNNDGMIAAGTVLCTNNNFT